MVVMAAVAVLQLDRLVAATVVLVMMQFRSASGVESGVLLRSAASR